MSSTLDPNDAPHPAEADALPSEEGIAAGTIDEQLDTAPEEARNLTDGYAPADDEELED